MSYLFRVKLNAHYAGDLTEFYVEALDACTAISIVLKKAPGVRKCISCVMLAHSTDGLFHAVN